MSSSTISYDLVGVGFGPANLAIACALAEHQGTSALKKILFIEKHETFRWHPGMLLPGARMQISYMKDLATLRNPQSPYTFVSYLHSHGRLASFINRGSTVPSRKEFADYLSWAAHKVKTDGIEVTYGHEVVEISQGEPTGTVLIRSRSVASGELTSYVARNIVVSPGGSARIPNAFQPIIHRPLVLHSSTYAFSIDDALQQLASLKRSLRVGVVGSGQSAAEVTINLRERLSHLDVGESPHQIEMIVRKGSLKPSDDSPFSNEIFDPSATDTWYSTTSQLARDITLAEYRSTNYSVVNPLTIDALYEIIYDQKVDDAIRQRSGANIQDPRVTLHKHANVISASDDPNGPGSILVTQNTLTRTLSKHQYDLVVCATGYHRTSWINLLKQSILGKRYGIREGTEVRLEQVVDPSSKGAEELLNDADLSESISVRSSGSEITPPSSPGESDGGLMEDHGVSKVFISRNYRLAPVEGQAQWPRFYLQGVEENTHGLSDTLLSVVGIRAGEVVADLLHED